MQGKKRQVLCPTCGTDWLALPRYPTCPGCQAWRATLSLHRRRRWRIDGDGIWVGLFSSLCGGLGLAIVGFR